MKYALILFVVSLLIQSRSYSQQKKEDIYTDVVLAPHRRLLQKDLSERLIAKSFCLAIDSSSEYRFESACNAITQFQLNGADVRMGFEKMFTQYDSLQNSTKRAFLEAVYAVSPKKYEQQIDLISKKETDPKLFAMEVAYLFVSDSSVENANQLKLRMAEKFPSFDSTEILKTLFFYLSYHNSQKHQPTPDIVSLFFNQKVLGEKVIYSFQRWDRNYAGLAILQNADGSFAKNERGELQVFEQLARSGSDLPYFITNGSTPQGIYSVQGIEVAHNHLIGPTPNIQMLLPHEGNWKLYFHQKPSDGPLDSLRMYKQLLPESWREYEPMMETWEAGRIGRTEIIAHGTTIDPEYFKDKSFYPLTPTQGCLCAKELWNPSTGRLLLSDQFNLVKAFESTPGSHGYLFVINIDGQNRPVTAPEVERWVKAYEAGLSSKSVNASAAVHTNQRPYQKQ